MFIRDGDDSRASGSACDGRVFPMFLFVMVDLRVFYLSMETIACWMFSMKQRTRDSLRQQHHPSTMKAESRSRQMLLPPWNTDYSETVWDSSFNSRLEALQFECIDDEPRSAAMNLALDELLMHQTASGKRGATFRMWKWSERAVILGSYQSVRDEFDSALAEELGFSFGRRISGGGAMLVEPHRTITWSLTVPEHIVDGLSFRQSFAFLDMWCVRALRSMGIPAVYRPINDIASPSGKIAGAAQCRRRRTVLHHCTMAYDMDEALMWNILRLDQAKSSTKGVASAVKSVTALRQFIDTPYDDIRSYLMEAFASTFNITPTNITDAEAADMHRLAGEKFLSDDWLYRVQ